MSNAFFRRQLGRYAAVHRSGRNKATHFVGIPLIVFSLLLVLALCRVPLASLEISMALAIGGLAALGWIALDLGIGLIMAALLLAAGYAAQGLAGALGPATTIIAFFCLFIGGWILQFIGHIFEGRRPALVDNLFQGFIGPMFLVAETLVASGYRADLATVVGEGNVTAR